jgi:hypothetical protein
MKSFDRKDLTLVDSHTLKSISRCLMTRTLKGGSFSKNLFYHDRIKYGQGEQERKRKHFLFLTYEMRANVQNGGPHLLILYSRPGGIHIVKDNGCGWWRWLLKQGGVHPGPPRSETIGVISNFALVILHTSKETCSFLTSQRGQQKQEALVCLPVPVT